MDEDDTYRIMPTEEEIRREAVRKVVECSIMKDQIAEMERDISNLRYMLQILDETVPIRDDDGNVDIRPVYKRVRKEIMDILCRQMDLEQRMDVLQKEIDNTECLSNVKVVVKKL